MKRVTMWLLFGFLLLEVCLIGVVPARAAEDKPMPTPPSGFDVAREGVPRGNVETVEYDSKSVGAKRKMVIYTPPGYTKDSKYPVLYLLHGAGGNETNWTRQVAEAAILNNLYADKKIVAMIVVTPNGSVQPRGTTAQQPQPGAKGQPGRRAARADQAGSATSTSTCSGTIS